VHQPTFSTKQRIGMQVEGFVLNASFGDMDIDALGASVPFRA
jgi:hypothetical protein